MEIPYLITEEGQLWIAQVADYGTIGDSSQPSINGYSKAHPSVARLRRIVCADNIVLLTEDGRVGNWNSREVQYFDLPEVKDIFMSLNYLSPVILLEDGRLIKIIDGKIMAVLRTGVKWIIKGQFTDVYVGEDFIETNSEKVHLNERIIHAQESMILTESGRMILYPFSTNIFISSGNIVNVQHRLSQKMEIEYTLLDEDGYLSVLRINGDEYQISSLEPSRRFKRFLLLGYEVYQHLQDDHDNIYRYEIKDNILHLKLISLPGIPLDLNKRCLLKSNEYER